MTIDELKRALVEVKQICMDSDRCCYCPFCYDMDDGRVMCRLSDDENVMFTPLCWDVDDWKENKQMKTPDTAKENNFVLREAARAACDGYYTHLSAGGKGDPAEERWIEALTAGADAITQVAVLESRLAQVERERNAAVADLVDDGDCRYCKNINLSDGCGLGNCCTCANEECPCCNCNRANNQFDWRGVCPENSKEDAKE